MTRRLASLATLLLFAQLTLVVGVARCWLVASGTHATHEGVTTGHGGNHGESTSHDAGKGGAVPECTATSMCAVVMLPPVASDAARYSVPQHERTAAAPTTPVSITQAPELPPPRG